MQRLFILSVTATALLQSVAWSTAHAQPTAMKHNLPPGLQKRLDQGKPLPPGWAQKLQPGQRLDQDILDRARVISRSPDNNQITVQVDDEVIRIARATREILAILGR